MTYCLLRVSSALMVLCSVSLADDTDVNRLLKGIEKRYNSVKTLEAGFSETYRYQGQSRTETGVLYLRKPGKMRWDYQNPQGKLFVSDGKNAYFYTPDNNRAEKIKLKETEDLRAPMAFLLGRLDFSREFRDFSAKPDSAGTWITAMPKTDDLPYRQVQFLAKEDFRLERLIITGQDSSVLDFIFADERRGVPVNESIFHFKLPPGAQYVESSQNGGER